MKLKSRIKYWAQDAVLIAAAALVIVILDYEAFIRKRNEGR
jgi:hypothetical protein